MWPRLTGPGLHGSRGRAAVGGGAPAAVRRPQGLWLPLQAESDPVSALIVTRPGGLILPQFCSFSYQITVVIAYRAGSVCVAFMSQFTNVPILRLWRRGRNAIPVIDEY